MNLKDRKTKSAGGYHRSPVISVSIMPRMFMLQRWSNLWVIWNGPGGRNKTSVRFRAINEEHLTKYCICAMPCNSFISHLSNLKTCPLTCQKEMTVCYYTPNASTHIHEILNRWNEILNSLPEFLYVKRNWTVALHWEWWFLILLWYFLYLSIFIILSFHSDISHGICLTFWLSNFEGLLTYNRKSYACSRENLHNVFFLLQWTECANTFEVKECIHVLVPYPFPWGIGPLWLINLNQ